MRSLTVRMLALAMAVALQAATAGPVHAISIEELEQVIQQQGRAEIRFVETRESPWLESERVSRGVFMQAPGTLEKRVLEPRPERWTLHRDRAVWEDGGGTGPRTVHFAEAPQLAILANAIRGIVAGDLVDLGPLFDIVPSGTHDAWDMTLRPRDAKLAGALESIVCTGNAGGLETLVIHERNGQRTTTRLHRDE